MRIAFVPAARLLSDRRANGEGLIAEALLRRLAARGHEVVAYCEEADFAEPITGVEVREISAQAPSAALSRIAFAKRIARDVARERFDVAHLLFPLNTAEGYAMVRGVPLVAGPMFLPWPASVAPKPRAAARVANAWLGRRERRMHARTLRCADKLLVTGSASVAAIPASLHHKVEEIPFGVDSARIPVAPLPEEPTIGFLSVLQRRKGADVLLRAMPAVLRAVPRARLLLAGDDPSGLRPELEHLAASLGVAHAVTFWGPVAPGDEAFAMHRRARVFCQPSIGEPFGMAVLEAMATGRPVVATAAGGVTDIVVDGEGGRLIRPGDERLLADALISVLSDPAAAARMGAANRRRVEQRFDLDGVTSKIEAVYASLAGVRKDPVHAA